MRLLLLILLCLTIQPVAALDITDGLLQGKVADLGDAALILQDPGNTFDAEAAIKRMSEPAYQPGKFTPSVKRYWLYTSLINRSKQLQWTIHANNLIFDKLDFYLYCQGQPLQYIPQPPFGFNSPNLASTYVIPVVLPYNTQCGFLQHVGGTDTTIKTYLMAPDVASKQTVWLTAINLLGMGAIAGLIIYNLLLYVSIRSSVYFFYSVYATIHLVLMVSVNFKPPEIAEHFANLQQALLVLSACAMISAMIFTFRFMQPGIELARHNSVRPTIAKLISILVKSGWVAVFLILLFSLHALAFPEQVAEIVLPYRIIYLLSSLMIPVFSLVIALSGYKPAWVFFPAWSILFASHIIGVLYILGIIALVSTPRTTMVLAAAMEMMLLSLALGMNLKNSRAERNRAQTARENAELRMQQQEKFVSTLSHEIRTPLHAMLGSHTLLGHTPLSDKQKDYWNTTHYAAESMYELVDNLLDRTQAKHARLTDKNTVFEPQRLLESMIHLLRSRAEEKALSLSLHTQALPDYLEGNPVVLRRVLINLISNAVKYTDEGKISVHVSWSAAQSELHVIVKDTGRGMSARQLRQVRQSFNMGVEALYSQQASSGLGLPICFEMLQEAGGRLTLDSEPGQGTSVHFSLPMQLSAEPVESVAAPTSEQMADMAMAVLVVDDVETNRLVARDLLESAGHQVSTADGGKQALALMQEQDFDAVLSDMRMPEMNGEQLLEQLRERYSPEELIIVMTSAHFDQQQQEKLLAMGATVCLAKPHSPQALFTAIQGRVPEPGKPLPPVLNLHDATSAKICELYNRQLKDDIARIHTGLDQQDMETIRIAAHRIVSASRALGLERQADVALQIENGDAYTAKDWREVRQLVIKYTGQLSEDLT